MKQPAQVDNTFHLVPIHETFNAKARTDYTVTAPRRQGAEIEGHPSAPCRI